MKGFIKVEAVERDGHEGLSCETQLENVGLEDRVQIVHAIALSLKMSPWQLHMVADMMQSGVLGDKPDEVVYDRSVRQQVPAGRGLDGFLAMILGGVLRYESRCV